MVVLKIISGVSSMQFTVRAAAMFMILVQLVGIPAVARGPDPHTIQAHMEFLADDLLQGREPGTPGYDLAALYVASQFRSIGLDPAGRDRTYFQPVPLRRSRLAPKGVTLRIEDGAGGIFTNADHVVAYPSPVSAEEDLRGKAVFAGHGIVEPRLGRDDYAGLDVRGKMVIVLGQRSESQPKLPRISLVPARRPRERPSVARSA